MEVVPPETESAEQKSVAMPALEVPAASAASAVELEIPLDHFGQGEPAGEKQIHQDFWQGFDPKDLGEGLE